MRLEDQIKDTVTRTVEAAGRPDLFRAPLVAFSDASDERYIELKTMVGDWVKAPRELLPESRSVISIFVPYTREVSQSVLKEEPVARLWGEAYMVLNDLFKTMGEQAIALLEEAGHESMSIAATHTYDPKTLQSLWSHRSAAAIAGLGSFGVNRMLFTEKGSGGRYGSILTSAPLETAKEPAREYCRYHIDGSCLICLDVCPVEALSVGSLDKFTCHDRLLENREILKDLGGPDVCGKCLAHCPVAYIE